jgi:transposase
VSHTVIGGISAYGVVNVSLRVPGNVKKRRVVGAKRRKAPEGVAAAIPKGTTAGHFVQFISDTLDIMDAFPNMKVFHIVMDNAPIHPRNVVDPIASQRGYIPVYLPPHSPELNPIEMFWKVLKDRVKRGKLTDAETLSSRIIEGSEDVSVEHLQNFIQHSINVISNYLNKKPLWSVCLVKLFLLSGQFILKKLGK